VRIQKEITKQSEQNKNTNIFNSLKKMGKKFEIFEKNLNYAHKNLGISLSVNEFDFKDKEIKLLNYEETADRKEITNFIENLNDYSCRKLAGNMYVNKRFFDVKGKKFVSSASLAGANANTFVAGRTGLNQNLIVNTVDVQSKINHEEEIQKKEKILVNGIEKSRNKENNKTLDNFQKENKIDNINTKSNNSCNNHHQHETHKRSTFFSNKLSEMKHNYLLDKAHHSKDNSQNAKESLEIFNQLNEGFVKAPKSSNVDKIRTEDNNLIIEILNKHEIIKDIFLINNYIKYSNYSDQLKKQKRNLVKNFTNEIEAYRVHMKNNRNLSNPVKANLELLNSFLNKIKPNTASSG